MSNSHNAPAPLIQMAEEASTTYRELFAEIICYGTIGSGKTSGSGFPLNGLDSDGTSTTKACEVDESE